MLHVINQASKGAENSVEYIKFLELAAVCYNLLRRKSRLLIDLFVLMVPAGIPELRAVEDIQYMYVWGCVGVWGCGGVGV